ncbi:MULTISPECIES: metallopeptidase family protein [Nocardioides]|uniref:Metallopeptidase family protein n=1 Tax=Nocardioides vastitatis TaxID=2568655 RepID=A0ABW0ZDX7_9ACTN|nr:metallopeptidase family protein [Nocardioides sp.]THJ05342.1 metallopeptidase family protein [Nocardioides sp.]
MDPDSVPIEEFEAMVVEALDSLPEFVLPMMREIAVLVEDEQPAEERQRGQLLLGVFRGVPWTAHGGRIPGTLPSTITLYRIPILAVCRRPEDVPPRVLKVLGHEVGHAVGLGEATLRDLGWH